MQLPLILKLDETVRTVMLKQEVSRQEATFRKALRGAEPAALGGRWHGAALAGLLGRALVDGLRAPLGALEHRERRV